MSALHLLPCPCGQTIPIAASQAGDRVTCGACGNAVEVPRLRELRELPLADPEATNPGGWGFREGLISVFLILAGLLALGGGWFSINTPEEPKPFDAASRMEVVEEGVESMTPVQLWESYVVRYAPMGEFGMYQATSPQDAYIRTLIESATWYRNLLWGGAGFFAMIAVVVSSIAARHPA